MDVFKLREYKNERKKRGSLQLREVIKVGSTKAIKKYAETLNCSVISTHLLRAVILQSCALKI